MKQLITYRCYRHAESENKKSVVGNSLFELIGKKEPDQTKALGYVLARSQLALRYFLLLIVPTKTIVKKLLKDNYLVDCELMFKTDEGTFKRADIVIRFPNYKYAILVEAKSLNTKTSSVIARTQGIGYVNLTNGNYTIQVVSLTSIIEYGNNIANVVQVKWHDIVNMFDKLINEHKNDDLWLEKDFFNYLLNINKLMNYYDVEVMSIPAKKTYAAIAEHGIYECPAKKSMKNRCVRKPLYVAFRGDKGVVDKLYKLEEIITMPLEGEYFDAALESLDKTVKTRIRNYIKKCQPTNPSEQKWVFILDLNHCVNLPYKVKPKRDNSNTEVNRSLSEYFAQPTKGKNGEKIVILKQLGKYFPRK